jgi:riboflavin synthase
VFTGIIERSLPLLDAHPTASGVRLTIANVWPDVRHGESIAINGCCLTVAQHDAQQIHFDVIPESLAKTNLGTLSRGDEVHVERSLKMGDRLDGHVVQGHVDTTAPILSHTDGADWRIRVATPPAFAKYLVPKGSVTLDGTSLTIAALGPDWFEVALIPTTLEITRLGRRPTGWPLNVEFDSMVKTIVTVVERTLESRANAAVGA